MTEILSHAAEQLASSAVELRRFDDTTIQAFNARARRNVAANDPLRGRAM